MVTSLLFASALAGCAPSSADVATCKEVATGLVALSGAVIAEDWEKVDRAISLIEEAGLNSTTALGTDVTNSLNAFKLAAGAESLPPGMWAVSQSVVSECADLGVLLAF
ncbi:hypothetical protein GCM10009655_12710 [Rhodoglobus aureus]|uniref:Lipoprotein n=2 Tax=Rhodoglobus aureus TaxID=191497 RepID=A0ABN1VK78_9MICO